MASSDIGFVSALMRIRTRAYQSGITASGLSSAHETLGLTTQPHFFSSLPNTVGILTQISAPGSAGGIDLRSRWDRPSQDFDMGIDPNAFKAGVSGHVTGEGSSAGTNGDIPIQDLFAPVRLPTYLCNLTPTVVSPLTISYLLDIHGLEDSPRLDPRSHVS
jgi:hypothetical protein